MRAAYPEQARQESLGIAEEEEMREIAVKRSESDGMVALELKFKALDQLLDPEDPHPLPERELTDWPKRRSPGTSMNSS